MIYKQDFSLDNYVKAASNKKLEELVVRDGLTNLYNHRYFQERTEEEVSRANRYNLVLSLVFFDLDYFKNYNDTNGHINGDQALIKVAEILRNSMRKSDVVARVRKTDIVARYGGEEFVVLLPETSKDGAKVMAERLRKVIESQEFTGEDKLPGGKLTISAGIASFPDDASTRTELIEKADQACYHAKASGRNTVCLYDK